MKWKRVHDMTATVWTDGERTLTDIELLLELTTQLDTLTRENKQLAEALEKIEAGQNATQVRGGLVDIGVPDHLIDEDGWVPIDPMMQCGLRHAANIATEAVAARRERLQKG